MISQLRIRYHAVSNYCAIGACTAQRWPDQLYTWEQLPRSTGHGSEENKIYSDTFQSKM